VLFDWRYTKYRAIFIAIMTASAELPSSEQQCLHAEATYRAYLDGAPGITFEAALNATIEAVEQESTASRLQSWRRLGQGALILQDNSWYRTDTIDEHRLEAEVQYSIGQAAEDQAEFFADVRKARGHYVYEPSRRLPIVWGRPTIMHINDTPHARYLLGRVFEGGQVHLASFIGQHVRFEPSDDQPNLP
jgi:hypothetical protein